MQLTTMDGINKVSEDVVLHQQPNTGVEKQSNSIPYARKRAKNRDQTFDFESRPIRFLRLYVSLLLR